MIEDPSLHYVYADSDGNYPSEPFWNLLIDSVGKAPFYTFDKSGKYFGYGSFDAWKDTINSTPTKWEVIGTRSSFAFIPKLSTSPSGLAAHTPVRSGETDGIQWKIVLTPRGSHLNGYVHIPAGHSLRGMDYMEIENIEVHGGLTFSEDDWLGFDTAHYGDLWSDEELEKVGGSNITAAEHWPTIGGKEIVQWTLDKLEEETKYLARQVAAYV